MVGQADGQVDGWTTDSIKGFCEVNKDCVELMSAPDTSAEIEAWQTACQQSHNLRRSHTVTLATSPAPDRWPNDFSMTLCEDFSYDGEHSKIPQWLSHTC